LTSKTYGYSQFGQHPQATLNKQAVNSVDLLFACFKTRLGAKTPDSNSGTTEEIETYMAKKNHVAIFFSKESADISAIDPIQLEELNRFKLKITTMGLYEEYSNQNDLRESNKKFSASH
jgi:hypothetical protein